MARPRLRDGNVKVEEEGEKRKDGGRKDFVGENIRKTLFSSFTDVVLGRNFMHLLLPSFLFVLVGAPASQENFPRVPSMQNNKGGRRREIVKVCLKFFRISLRLHVRSIRNGFIARDNRSRVFGRRVASLLTLVSAAAIRFAVGRPFALA